MKKVVISLIILFLIFGSFLIYFFTSVRNKEESKTVQDTVNIESKEDLSEKEDNKDEPITEIIEDDNSGNENISNNDVPSNKNNLESNNATNTNVIKKEVNKPSIVEQEKPKEEVKPVAPESTSEPKVEQHQPTAWESLGISEYDYYNKPMWSWARVDYSVKTYGNFEQTHQACIDAGNSMENIISFSCTNINSYSGDYLGDMLRVKN